MSAGIPITPGISNTPIVDVATYVITPKMPGAMMGIVTWRAVLNVPTCDIDDASSSAGSMLRNSPMTIRKIVAAKRSPSTKIIAPMLSGLNGPRSHPSHKMNGWLMSPVRG